MEVAPARIDVGTSAGALGSRWTDRRLWLVCAISFALACVARFSGVLTIDTLYGLSSGRYVLAHGLPQHNVVTLANHGAAWIDQQWLAHAVLYSAWRIGGDHGVLLLSSVTTAAGFGILTSLLMRRGVPPRLACCWTFGAVVVCLANTTARAQSLAYPLFALVLWLLVDDDRAATFRRRTLLAVPVLAVWANVHGSVLFGAGIVVVYAAARGALGLARRDRRSVASYAGLAAGAVAAVGITPYGPAILSYYRSVVADERFFAKGVAEWGAPSLTNPVCWTFFVMAAVSVGLFALRWRRGARPSIPMTLLLATTVALGFRSIRFEMWLGLVAPTVLASAAATGVDQAAARVDGILKRVLCGCVLAAALLMVGVLLTTPAGTLERPAPVAAVHAAAERLTQDPSAKVIGDELAGTTMLWFEPSSWGRVAYDTRLEQYDVPQLDEFLRFVNAEGRDWPDTLRGYSIAVASKQVHPDLARRLEHLDGWTVIWNDRDGIAVARS